MRIKQRHCCSTSALSSSGHLLQRCSVIAQPGDWRCCSPPVLPRFPQFYFYSCVYACQALCSFVTCVDFCVYHHSQESKQFQPQGSPAVLLELHPPPSCSFPPLRHKPWQPLVCPFKNFVISKMLRKWNHTVCNLLGLAFFAQHNSLEFVQAVECISSSFLFFAE